MPLPQTDSFDGGSPAYDTSKLCGSYVRFLGWSSDPVYGSSGTGFSVSWTKYGKAFSGHSGESMTSLLVAEGGRAGSVNRCVLTTEAQFGDDIGNIQPTGFALRDWSAAEVQVSMAFAVKTHVATTVAGVFRVGIGARLSGGTITDAGTSTAHLLGGDGYYFLVLGNTNGVQYQLARVNGGTLTRLAQTPSGDPASAANCTPYATWFASNATKTLRLTVHTNGSVVELRGYVRVGSAAETLVLSVDDSSGSRITAAGRAGFLTSNEGATGGSAARCYPIHYFRIHTYAGVLVSNDDWTRLALGACAAVTRTFTGGTFPVYAGFGANGRDLTSGWFGDLRGVSTYQARVDRSSDRILFNSSLSDRTGYYLSQRLANDPRAQDREITFEFATGGPGVSGLTRGVGIVLRGTAVEAGSTPERGYLLLAELVEDTLTSRVRLYRIRDSGLTMIARKTSGVTFTRGTEYDLRLRVETLSTPDPLSGTAKLRAYLDGVLLELVDASPAATGVTVFSDGTVHDASSDRVTTGYGEGVYVRSLATATAHIYLDTWAVGVGGGDEGGDETQATIPIDAEDVAASGTFPVPYEWSSEQDDLPALLDHRLELDYRYLSPATDARRRTLRFGCKAATEAERDLLVEFWADQRGREIPFSFTWPDGSSSLARFTMDELRVERLAPGVHAWEATLEEVRDA